MKAPKEKQSSREFLFLVFHVHVQNNQVLTTKSTAPSPQNRYKPPLLSKPEVQGSMKNTVTAFFLCHAPSSTTGYKSHSSIYSWLTTGWACSGTHPPGCSGTVMKHPLYKQSQSSSRNNHNIFLVSLPASPSLRPRTSCSPP